VPQRGRSPTLGGGPRPRRLPRPPARLVPPLGTRRPTLSSIRRRLCVHWSACA
jgi:hypothetical protein